MSSAAILREVPSVLTTERLVLRKPGAQDVAAFAAYYETERSHWNGGPLPYGRAWRALASHVGAWDLNGFGMFVFTLKGDDTAMGFAGPWFPGDWPEKEIGWSVFSPEHEGKGFAFEAAQAAIAHAYGPLGWDTAVSYIAEVNHRSRALAERLGARVDETAVKPPFSTEIATVVYRHPNPHLQAKGI